MSETPDYEAAAEVVRRFVGECPIHKSIHDDLLARCTIRGEGQVIIVTGASGTGAHTIVRHLKSSLLKQCTVPHYRVVIEVQARPPEAGRFSWHGFYKRGRSELQDPMQFRKDRAEQFISAIRESRDDSSDRFRNAMLQRQCRTLIVTHADSILTGIRRDQVGQSLAAFADLASSRDRFPATVVLTGSPKLLDWRHVNDRLDRRAQIVHVRPLRADDAEERKAFARICLAIAELLKPYSEPDLIGTLNSTIRADRLAELHAAHIGIKGWLKRTYTLALQVAGAERAPALRWDHITDCLPTKREIEQAKRSTDQIDAWANDEDVPIPSDKKMQPRRGTGATRPFKRKPSQDPVGYES